MRAGMKWKASVGYALVMADVFAVQVFELYQYEMLGFYINFITLIPLLVFYAINYGTGDRFVAGHLKRAAIIYLWYMGWSVVGWGIYVLDNIWLQEMVGYGWGYLMLVVLIYVAVAGGVGIVRAFVVEYAYKEPVGNCLSIDMGAGSEVHVSTAECLAVDGDKRIKSGKNAAVIAYMLQGISFLFGVTFIVAAFISYEKIGDAKGTWLESHFLWQIRTFWYGLLWFIVGAVLALVVIGYVVIIGDVIWIMYRSIKGWLRLVDEKEMYT